MSSVNNIISANVDMYKNDVNNIDTENTATVINLYDNNVNMYNFDNVSSIDSVNRGSSIASVNSADVNSMCTINSVDAVNVNITDAVINVYLIMEVF